MNKAYNEMGIVATDSDFNKLVKIQRWIDHNWYYSQEINHDDAVEGYGLVKYGYSACGQFANNFKYFLDKTGIQCYVIGGDATNKNYPDIIGIGLILMDIGTTMIVKYLIQNHYLI